MGRLLLGDGFGTVIVFLNGNDGNGCSENCDVRVGETAKVSVEWVLTRTERDRTHRTVKFKYGEVEHVHDNVFADDATTNRELQN